ncbi:hypothetical protein [Mycobacterium szulgai]|uniref:Uncharacterized protein n=1 Tax=Mycobacterium szulgai TaxID=1787 RepID=A0A1X2FL41_MYCSZ|nr:hypothetical protein [Mycobacterium szulgai]MCV7078961.1 hypothetical protein [Mycobacterium szulgai]ORX19048.1 hypothetical protein AWC27_16485 [Mycobacterium szulgai]
MSDGKFDLDGHCLSQEHPWSILDLSLPNAQLAGVFAGFLILAITTLLTMSAAPGLKKGTRITQSIVLLGLGVVVLGQGAYFFGSIAATKPPETSQPPAPTNAVGNSVIVLAPENPQVAGQAQLATQRICERAWVQFMPAAGMLALGAVLLVAGLAWMIAWHRMAAPLVSDDNDLVGHANVAIAFVLWGAMAFLIFDVWYFVEEMHQELHALNQDSAANFEKWSATVVGFILCAISTWILVQKRNSLIGHNDDLHKEPNSVYAVAVWTAPYLFLNLLLTLWATASGMRSHPLFELWAGISLAVFGPGILFVLLAFAMPGTNGPWPRRVLTLGGLALGIAFLVRSSIFIFQLGHRLGAEEGQCRLTE